jgi:pimeloyl-ACP methyl ester carboxylesterase
MLTEKTFDAGAVSINYAEGPKAGPSVVLLHGVTGRWQRFLHLLPVLTQRWHVVAADLRGHGRSGHVAEGYGIMEYARDVIGLIRHLGDEPAVVLGHSLGAIVGIGVASEAPDAVRGLILEDPPLGAFRGRPFVERNEHSGFTVLRDLVREGHPPDELARRLAALDAGPVTLAHRMRASSLGQIDPDVLTLIIENRAVDGFDLEDRLRRVSCPTLLLHGNQDLGAALSIAEAEWAAALLADGILEAFPETGHHLLGGPNSTSERFRQVVTGFLEMVRPPDPAEGTPRRPASPVSS